MQVYFMLQLTPPYMNYPWDICGKCSSGKYFLEDFRVVLLILIKQWPKLRHYFHIGIHESVPAFIYVVQGLVALQKHPTLDKKKLLIIKKIKNINYSYINQVHDTYIVYLFLLSFSYCICPPVSPCLCISVL